MLSSRKIARHFLFYEFTNLAQKTDTAKKEFDFFGIGIDSERGVLRIGGKMYNCFNDYVNYKVVEYLHDNNIESFVNDDNQIELFLDNKEQLTLNRKLYCLLKEEHII